MFCAFNKMRAKFGRWLFLYVPLIFSVGVGVIMYFAQSGGQTETIGDAVLWLFLSSLLSALLVDILFCAAMLLLPCGACYFWLRHREKCKAARQLEKET